VIALLNTKTIVHCLRMTKLLFAYGSTSGHTEYVCQVCAASISKKKRSVECVLKKIEQITAKDLATADTIVLASSTWNTGGIEGQLHPYMYRFAYADFKDVDFAQKKIAVIGCGDERYFYTCKAADHLEEFVDTHNGARIEPTLRIVNEPYHQQHATIEAWCATILPALTSTT
jgi:flavodoxin I